MDNPIKNVSEIKLSHVEKFLSDVSEFIDDEFSNRDPVNRIYQRLIKDLQSRLAIEDTVHLFSKKT